MNERIKELAEQAGGQYPHGIYPNAILFYPNNLEKFAKLILLECDKVISKEVSLKYKDGIGESEDFMGGHFAASILARVVIKQHFGVEESKKQLICPKCGVDRFSVGCPNPNKLECGIKVEAQ